MPRVLLVAYDFPPVGGGSVMRSLKLTKYLPGLGWDVTVLTVDDPFDARLDPLLSGQVPPQVTIVRAWSLEPGRILQWWKRRRNPEPPPSRLASPSPAEARSVATSPVAQPRAAAPASLARRVYRIIRTLWLPDDKRLWRSAAVRAAVRDARHRRPDVIVSSGPPHTAHLIGSDLSRQLRVPHVIDLRDPWVGNPQRKSPFPLHERLVERQERRVVGGAAAVITTAATVTREVAARYPGLARVVTIRNGYDPDDIATTPDSAESDSGSADPTTTPTKFRIVYTGIFYGVRNPRRFFEALDLARTREPDLADRLEVVFVGPGGENEQLAREHDVSTLVHNLGFLSHRQTMETVARAGAALVINPDGAWSRSIPGKVYEYLGLRRHILLITGEGDLADLLADIQGVTRVSPDDPEAIAQALLTMLHDWEADALVRPRQDQVEQFSRVAVAERFAELLEEVTH